MKRTFLLALFAVLILMTGLSRGDATCSGRFPNPISDVCWNCFFPITIGGAKVGTGFDDSPRPPPICACPAPPPVFIRPGIGITFWSPDRAAEVVKTPMCSPMLGGKLLGKIPAPRGGVNAGGNVQKKAGGSFYHTHWMVMPLLQQLAMAAEGELCMKGDSSMDYVFFSEIDPLWADDELSLIMSPEALLFTSMPAQVACAADATKALVTNFGIDTLFWCAGGQGSLYPLTGYKQHHQGGPDTALALTQRMAFTLHRAMLLKDTSTVGAMCANQTQLTMRKGQYKSAFMYPVPSTMRAYGFGVPSLHFHTGREFPYKGEDYSLMVWRRHTCCML